MIVVYYTGTENPQDRESLGTTPLPPRNANIRSARENMDRERYSFKHDLTPSIGEIYDYSPKNPYISPYPGPDSIEEDEQAIHTTRWRRKPMNDQPMPAQMY